MNRSSARALCSILVFALCAGTASAQTYPNRPVKIINPFGAGGVGDIFMRPMAQKLSEWMGQQFLIENRPGASGAIGAEAVAKSAPDGYTLLFISPTHAVNETLNPNRPYRLIRDFVPVTQLFSASNVIIVHPSVPAFSVKELIALAKAQPGKLAYASSGSGSPFHLAAELFRKLAEVDLLHVPYKAAGAARSDVLSGQVQMMFDSVVTAQPLARSGKVRAIATTGASRSPMMPDLPTIAEAGVSGYESEAWGALVAPAGTPAPVITRLQGEIAQYLNLPEVRTLLAQQGMVPIGSSPEVFAGVLGAEVEKWGAVVKFSGAKFE